LMEPRVWFRRSSRVCVVSSVDEPCINILSIPDILSPAIANTKLAFYREVLNVIRAAGIKTKTEGKNLKRAAIGIDGINGIDGIWG